MCAYPGRYTGIFMCTCLNSRCVYLSVTGLCCCAPPPPILSGCLSVSNIECYYLLQWLQSVAGPGRKVRLGCLVICRHLLAYTGSELSPPPPTLEKVWSRKLPGLQREAGRWEECGREVVWCREYSARAVCITPCDRRFWSSSNLPELTFCPRVEKHKQKWLSWPLDSAWFLLCA